MIQDVNYRRNCDSAAAWQEAKSVFDLYMGWLVGDSSAIQTDAFAQAMDKDAPKYSVLRWGNGSMQHGLRTLRKYDFKDSRILAKWIFARCKFIRLEY